MNKAANFCNRVVDRSSYNKADAKSGGERDGRIEDDGGDDDSGSTAAGVTDGVRDSIEQEQYVERDEVVE